MCVGKLTNIGSDNGFSQRPRQAIIWTNVGILLIWPLGINFHDFFYRNSNIFIEENMLILSSAKFCPFPVCLMPQSHHTSGPRTGCSRAVLNKNRTSTQGARTGLEIVNSPWTAFAGPVRGPYGQRTTKYDARAGVLPILVVSIPLRVRMAAVRHPCGSRTGPVRVPYDMKNIKDFRAMPVRCPYGPRTGYSWSPENYSTKP